MTGATNVEEHGKHRARILIVDDEPLNVDYLEQELESHGFTTDSARDGLEALDRVADAPPDLVLLDVMMPELDGIRVLRLLKDDPDTKFIPVVLMTALNAVEDRVRGIEAGADDFLSKPVDDRELLARIRTALAHKRAVEATVDELHRASTHLERHGRREREVVVLAVHPRHRDGAAKREVVRFLGRRQTRAVTRLLQSHGGTKSEVDGEALIAVFDAPDAGDRALAAVEAGLAIIALLSSGGGAADVVYGAAIAGGLAVVGSTRVEDAGQARWVYGAEGRPVECATRLAQQGASGELVVSGDVAASVSAHFVLQPSGSDHYRLLAPSPGGDGSGPRRESSHRRLRTIVFTDVVGSTMTVERIGDRAGGELLAAHARTARSELVLFGGEEIDAVGDSFVASFDSAAGAIRYALAVFERVALLGLTLRAGIHTGELELVDGEARGIALHLGSRIAARAAPGEVLVSATTRELASGSELSFMDRGEHALRGVSRPSRLYAALDEPSRNSASRRSPAPAVADLTAREIEVLKLVSAGLSDAEVARRLYLSVRTVNAHLRSIYRKTGVRSRAAAGRFAEKNGLL